jgi:hypothetical protein
MATPARRLILQDLKTTLESITVANGYKNTVKKVEAVAKGFADTVVGDKPWIGIYPQQEMFQFEHGGMIRVVSTLLVMVHIAGATVDSRSDVLNDFLDDIIAAMNVDTTRGGNAVMTTVNSVQTDEGDPDAYGNGSMIVSTDITYFRTQSKS